MNTGIGSKKINTKSISSRIVFITLVVGSVFLTLIVYIPAFLDTFGLLDDYMSEMRDKEYPWLLQRVSTLLMLSLVTLGLFLWNKKSKIIVINSVVALITNSVWLIVLIRSDSIFSSDILIISIGLFLEWYLLPLIYIFKQIKL